MTDTRASPFSFRFPNNRRVCGAILKGGPRRTLLAKLRNWGFGRRSFVGYQLGASGRLSPKRRRLKPELQRSALTEQQSFASAGTKRHGVSPIEAGAT